MQDANSLHAHTHTHTRSMLRLQVTQYVHSASHLMGIQVDAGINPGNSGGCCHHRVAFYFKAAAVYAFIYICKQRQLQRKMHTCIRYLYTVYKCMYATPCRVTFSLFLGGSNSKFEVRRVVEHRAHVSCPALGSGPFSARPFDPTHAHVQRGWVVWGALAASS